MVKAVILPSGRLERKELKLLKFFSNKTEIKLKLSESKKIFKLLETLCMV
ncbi:MAG: hypothetical protein NC826_00780 [Candidatus Omnitrophica bacterium]|nr:hypothetical protein [Candidatus Omnitrophota bacterium]